LLLSSIPIDLIIYRFYHFFEIKIMTMNTAFNLSGEAGRKCAIDIAGSPSQAMMRSGAYTVKVPYSSLSQTIHSIGKRGGKVLNVRMLSTPMPGVEDIPVASGFLIPLDQMDVDPSPRLPAKTVQPPQPEARRQQQKSKKR
jgi:phycocyanin-associated, rod